MASLMPNGKQQYFSNAGIPLVGGKVYTYAAGTTTPLATYTDSGGGTPNTNPVILDSRGEASIFFDTANYKIVLKDSADATIWTQDNLVGNAAASALASLAASTGSSLVGFIQSGTGAVARTVQDKARESVSVTDFYANGVSGVPVDPLGVVDSTLGIQAAIDSAKSVHFPPGTYKITAPITLSQNIFQITGVKGKSILMGSGGSSIFGYFRVMTQFFADFGTIEGLTFDSDDATQTRWAIYSPSSVYLSHWRIAECNFNGRLTGGIIANLIACHVYRCYFGVYFNSATMVAIQSVGQVAPQPASTNINVIEQCEFSGMGTPAANVVFTTGYKLIFKECIFEQLNPTAAVVILSGIAFPVFDNCWFENAQGSTDVGKSVIWTRQDANSISCEVLTVNDCLFHTYSTIPSGLINMSDSSRKNVDFSKNFLVSLQSPVIVGGNSVATFLNSYGNTATVGVGGDATGLQYNSPAKFDLGIAPTVVVTPAVSFPVTQVISSDPNTLDDYEEAAFTPTDASGAGLTLATAIGIYTKVGRIVTFTETIVYPVTANGSVAILSKPPFTITNEIAVSIVTNAGVALQGFVNSSGIILYANGTFTGVTNASLSGKVLYITGTYTTTT